MTVEQVVAEIVAKVIREELQPIIEDLEYLKKLEGWESLPRESRGKEWEANRAKALERDGHKCVECGTTQRLNVHHIVTFEDGGTHALENLVVLCHGHHRTAHAKMRKKT